MSDRPGTSAARYGAYADGPDPLAPPYDIARAVDSIGDRVLDGEGTADALRELLREGPPDGSGGLQELLRQVRQRQRELRESGRLDGTLEQVRDLLDSAVEAEQAALFPDPDDDARFREAQLDALPTDTARAVRELAEYDWRSPNAREAYDQIKQLLQREVIDQQFAGLRDSLASAADGSIDPADMQRMKDMLSDLNGLLAKRANGTDTDDDFRAFMDQHGALFPEQPHSLDELLEQLARRAAAAEQLMRSLSPDQQDELASLMQQAMSDFDLASLMGQLNDNLRGLRPDLFRSGRQQMRGDEPLGLADATSALSELAELDALAEQLGQGYAGATMDDVDEELVRRMLGRAAVDDLDALRRLERELVDQGFLVRQTGELGLSPKAVRRLGLTALRRVFSDLAESARGTHDVRDAGASGELTGASRAWEFGDEQPIDVVRTVTNAVRRGLAASGESAAEPTSRRARTLSVDDFEVVETERRSAAAVCLLVDTSWSMVLNGTWGEAKRTALALHTLVTTMFPADAVQVVAFSDYARELQATELIGMDIAPVQGTNLQHALLLAGRFIDKHPGFDPVVLVVTDGEPTARLLRDGTAWFTWPPERETVAATVAQVDAMTRRGAALNVFVLGDDPSLRRFVDDVVQRNGGRVFAPQPGRLGEYVVRDFLARRRTGRAR
ncbi:MAG: hypothetical protein WAN48_01055 [Actinomycetes bacterium]